MRGRFAMKLGSQYANRQEGAWRLWFRRDLWNDDIWCLVRERLAAQSPAKHPRTLELYASGAASPLFLKIFYRASALGSFKDFFRQSKAVSSLYQTEELAELGFKVPLVVAAGEERRFNVLRRSFLVTLPVSGGSLPSYLRAQYNGAVRLIPLRRKRVWIAQMAGEIRRLHGHCFIHGDLVPGNIFIAPAGHEADFFLMDNDRTRRYPRWLASFLRRRNLIQLNRFPLAGISLQDRMRFFHAYVGLGKLGHRERRLLRWLERRTRRRRMECDGIDSPVSFRRLMRWDATSQ